MWLIGQAPAGPDTIELVQYGALGGIVIALLVGWLWARPAVDRIIEENRQLRERLDRYEHEILREARGLRRDVQGLIDDERSRRNPTSRTDERGRRPGDEVERRRLG